MSKTSFFQEFDPVSKEQWLALVQRDLKGADFNEKLVWNSPEGLAIQPFYTAEDIADLAHLKQLHHADFDQDNAFLGARKWSYCQHILVKDTKTANTEALRALNEGAEMICFDLRKTTQQPDWAMLLKDIQWTYCSIGCIVTASQAMWLEGLQKQWGNTDKESITGFWQVEGSTDDAKLQQYVADYPNFKSASLVHSATDKVANKIGALLHQAYLLIQRQQKAGIDPLNALQNACFHYQLDNNYFFQMAGLRALKLLLKGMLTEYGVSSESFSPTIHAITTIDTSEKAQKAPEWNMLSNTTQAMSAILGGCHYLSILPHNQGIGEVTDFSERIARNVSNLLRDESYFDKVADPVAGSYYIEHLTEELSASAWRYFQEQL